MISPKNPRWRTAAILKIILAISQRHIVRLTWNLKWGNRITCWQMSYDQNCKFRKFKMADGRHFEIGSFSKAQPRIMRFRWNLVCRCAVWFGDLACKQFCNDSFSSPQRVKLLLLLLLYAVTHAPFHAPVLRPTSWPNARDRRDGEVN